MTDLPRQWLDTFGPSMQPPTSQQHYDAQQMEYGRNLASTTNPTEYGRLMMVQGIPGTTGIGKAPTQNFFRRRR